MSFPEITLRYFNCHGRAQHFRYYFLAREIAFTDERIELDKNWAAWQAIKNDESKTGPFHKLPVLEWGELSLVEGPVIQDWLHQQSGDASILSQEENLRHAMLTSSCISEVMMPTALLLWVEITHPGVDLKQQVLATLPRVKDHLASVEETLKHWNWWEALSQRKIMLADCLLWQQLWVISHVFGDALEIEAFPGMHDFFQHCTSRDVFEVLIKDYPVQLTGRAEEPEVIKRIQELL